MKKLTLPGIGALTLAAALALALPAQADEKTSQVDFVIDCNDDGMVTVPSGRSLEVFNFLGGTGQITVNCIVTLAGDDSELNLAEGTDLLFQDAGGAYKDFTINGPTAAAFEIEVQVKKNSSIEANDFNVTVSGAEEDAC